MMKKISGFKFFYLSLIMTLTMLVGCYDDNELEDTTPPPVTGDTCYTSPLACSESTFTACASSSGTNAYYLWNGQIYNCLGTDCSSAVSELLCDACGGYFCKKK